MVLAYIHVQAMPSPRTASDKLSRRQIMDHATRIAEQPLFSAMCRCRGGGERIRMKPDGDDSCIPGDDHDDGHVAESR